MFLSDIFSSKGGGQCDMPERNTVHNPRLDLNMCGRAHTLGTGRGLLCLFFKYLVIYSVEDL